MPRSDQRPTIALYHHLPPGGAERALIELTRRTADDFRYVLFEVELGGRDPFAGRDRSELCSLVDDVVTVSARAGGAGRVGRWAQTIPNILRAERKISAMIEERSPAAVVVHHQRFTQAPSLLLRTARPTVYFVQEPRRRSFEHALQDLPATGVRRLTRAPIDRIEAWARSFDIRATRAATTILCNSDHSREYIWRAYGRDATVVRLGVDLDRFTLPGDGPREPVILSVGGLDATKGHELLVDALGEVAGEHRPELRVITNRPDQPSAAALKERARALDVQVRIDSELSEAELVGAYQRATAVGLAARVEPLGLVALEAAACGTPAVAVREGGYRETIIHDHTGLLVDRSPVALGDAIERVASGAWQADRSALRSHVERNHHWDRAADVYRASITAFV